MRTLFLLSGAPGSGKTTLISALGVEGLVLGYDMFRALFSPEVPCVDESGRDGVTLRLPSRAEFAVVSATQAALKARLAAGATVFFDATNSRASDQTDLAQLAAKYGYRTVLIDCQGDLSLETLLVRNRARGLKQVSAEIVAEMHERCAAKPVSALIDSVIDGTRPVPEVMDAISRLAAVPALHIPRDRQVVVVGDVHSCAEALEEALHEFGTPQTHWVFAGDLFDRGPDPAGVMRIVSALVAEGRGTVVTGNHELNLRAISTLSEQTRFSDTRVTRQALLEAGITEEEQVAFVNSTVPALHIYIEGDDQPWLVTHGGVGILTQHKLQDSGLLHVSDTECVYGLGDRGRTYRAKTSYNVADMPLVGFQLHGHRNGGTDDEPVEAVSIDRRGTPVICLESGASSGGHVSLPELSTNEYYSVHRFDDRVDPQLAARNRAATRPVKPVAAVDPTDATDLLERMRQSGWVTVKPVDGVADVVACNFTRQAFQRGAWDDLTVHARGLFINAATGKIVARGYEKFFHIGEAPGRSLDGWLNEHVTAYPVQLRKKYNGYLALVSSLGDGKLAVFSKAGVTSYAKHAREMLLTHLGNGAEAALAGMLERTNTTAVFEVIAAHDTHPIAESGEDRLVLLDCILNEVTFRTDDRIRTGISRRFGFEVAEAEQTLFTPDELAAALKAAADRPDEGVVIVDAHGYRSKVKAHMYAERKSARTALERYWRGTADTLGPRFAALEAALHQHQLLAAVRRGGFTVHGVDGQPRLDLAGVFDALEKLDRK
ncbi:RNA ligase [Leucobacter sp. HY1910]